MKTNIHIRKIATGIVLCVTMLLNSFLAVAQKPQKVVMNLTQSPATEMAFNWFTTTNTTGEQVQIATGTVTNPNLFVPFKTVNATTNQNRHKAVVTDLSPNTKYSFRVGKAGLWSEIGSFTTAKAGKEPFSFLYVTDTQVDTLNIKNNEWRKNVKSAFTQCPNVNFWLHCGDFARDWFAGNFDSVIAQQQDYFYKYPFAPTQGNHDNPAINSFNNLNIASFDSYGNGSTYTFTYGDVQFFAINSELYGNQLDAYKSNLSAWMTANVKARPDIKWRIVYYHKVAYSGSGGITGDTKCRDWRDAMAPLFDALDIDIAFQGHSHVYDVIGPVKNKALVPGAVKDVQQGAGLINFPQNANGKSGGTFNVQEGTLYFTNGSFGDWYYAPLSTTQLSSNITVFDIPNYSSLATGRVGSFCAASSYALNCGTNNTTSTYSNVSVSSDSIIISTYAAVNGVSTLFDKIKVVKHCIPSPNAPSDTTINGTKTWDKPNIGNVTIPSNATLIVKTNITAANCSVITIQNGGKLIVDGGTIDGATIIAKSGSNCTIQNNGKILLKKFDDFDIQLGATFDLISGEVSPK